MLETQRAGGVGSATAAGGTIPVPIPALSRGVVGDARKPVVRCREDHSEKLIIYSLIGDSAFTLIALVLAYFSRFHTALYTLKGIQPPSFDSYSGYIFIGAIVQVFALSHWQIYEKGALLRFRFVSVQILKAVAFWFCVVMLFALMFHFQPPVSRVFVALAACYTAAGLLAWRWLFHRALRGSDYALGLRQRVAFVGWNEQAVDVSSAFQRDDVHPYEVIGAVVPSTGRFQEELPEEVPALGEISEIETLIYEHEIDMVILSDLDCESAEILALANLCEREMVEFKVIPTYFQILVSGLHLGTVSGIPILGVSKLPLDRFPNVILKQIIDVIGSIVGLILSAPLIAIFAALVYLESRGPIFYRQRRLGRNGRVFDIIKIRSMRLDAEADGRPGWTRENDSRCLRVGSFMRRWNIDELPQFWNVLRGDMSLVGPRPERPELILNFKHEIPHYNARHNVKPGITGWAQIRGFRGDTDLAERINCDLYYLENWSVLLDFQIMFMTFFARKNAY